MRKKVIAIVLVLLIIAVGVIAGLKHFNKKNVEIKYLNEVTAASTITNYLSTAFPDILMYLKHNGIKTRTTLQNIEIAPPRYKNCTGTVTPTDGTYLLEAECKGVGQDGYNVSYSIAKGEKLELLTGILKANNSNIYYGSSKDDKKLIIGNIDDNLKINWETEIPVLMADSMIQKVNVVSDGYLIFILNYDGNSVSGYDVIKLNQSGKIINTKKLTNNYSIYNTDNDTTLISKDKKAILLDKNANVIKEIEDLEINCATIKDDKIYYLDNKNELHILNKDGKEVKNIDLKYTDESITNIEVVNKKLFIAGTNNIIIYDLNGKILNTFNYSTLSIDKSIYNGEHMDVMIFDILRMNDDIYVNALVEGYNLIDHYDANLELVKRSVHQSPAIDIGSTIMNNTIVPAEKTSLINYSEKYGMFVKTNYIA